MYKKSDILLFTLKKFAKSLLFRLLLFMLDPIGIVIILMPLKLLQKKHNVIINQILS